MDITSCVPDTMLVCRNGHVLTDFAQAYPERRRSHCDRCGAATLDRCPTCGEGLAGAIAVPGLVPLGRLEPPNFCASCGVRFPWAEPAEGTASPPALATLETLLRRLPRAVRQLRSRNGNRPPFRIADEHDLEDLLRALLPLHFDNVRPQSRTPRYALDTRTDFLLPAEGIAVTAKRTTLEIRESQLAQQLEEDAQYYARQESCRTLVAFVYDPGQLVADPRRREAAWSERQDRPAVRSVIAS
jgi:hypothetical protein